MDKSKKIMIGAIGTVVVAGGVIIGLILGCKFIAHNISVSSWDAPVFCF